MAMCIAAKKYGIKVVEIQHGGAEDNVYLPYSNKQIKFDVLPDLLWCWSDSDKELVIKHNSDEFNYLKPFDYLKLFKDH